MKIIGMLIESPGGNIFYPIDFPSCKNRKCEFYSKGKDTLLCKICERNNKINEIFGEKSEVIEDVKKPIERYDVQLSKKWRRGR